MKKNWKNTVLFGLASLLPFAAVYAEEKGPATDLKPQAQASIPLPINRISKHMADMRTMVQEFSQNNSDVLMEYDNLTKLLKNAYLDNKTINEGDVHIILEAVGFASDNHKGQNLANFNQPYILHPMAMTEHLMTIGGVYDRDILVAALLQGTVEDAKANYQEISRSFGASVEGYVKEITVDKTLTAEERTKAQIANAGKLSKGAAQIKLADRYDIVKRLNANAPKEWDQKKVDEFMANTTQFVNQLPTANANLKKAFDDSLANSPKQKIDNSLIAK